MGINCNLEHRLLSSSSLPMNDSRQEESNGTSVERQEMTIFYNGQIHVCDATELQARAIILLARREMNESRMKMQTIESKSPSSPSSPQSVDESYNSTIGGLSMSMKRSLQRFLQKRNQRIQQRSAPYHR